MKNTSEHNYLRQASRLVCGLLALALGHWPGTAQAEETAARHVVIDPGHGGSNTGAPSVSPSIFEKHVTLAVAGEVAERLRKQGVRVTLTRTRDTYLSLRERGKLAHRHGADLFVSIHTNATESHSQRGFETFILSPRAVEIDGRALRGATGRSRPVADPGLAALLDDIETSTVQPRSAALAASIQKELRKVRGAGGDRGVKQDSMHVLLGATVPAVLVEIGFIDHPVEGPELLDDERRSDIADALARGILSQL
jgi:N-acetylmuramoyl-L-alanine amidase